MSDHTQADRELLRAFVEWKGYPLPALNNHGQFHQDWLHREFVAFKAGMALRSIPQGEEPAKAAAQGDELPPLPDGAKAYEYSGTTIVYGEQDMREYGAACRAGEKADARDAARLDWLLPNLHPANFGFEFEGGYEWESEEEFLAKFRKAIDAARSHTGGKEEGVSA